MKATILTIIVALSPVIALGQQNLVITRTDGTSEVIRVQPFNTEPTVLPIKPYGLNLGVANIPDRVSPYSPSYTPPSPGPVTIENPYFKPAPKPNWPWVRFIGAVIAILSQELS